MIKIVEEWIVKAEHDFETVELLINNDSESYEIICFHCQQCIEKYLKGYLINNNKDFPKTHDLVALINLCLEFDSSMQHVRGQCLELNEYAVAGRYPGEFVDIVDAKDAFKITMEVRDLLKKD